MPDFDFVQFGLSWPVWLAAAGTLAMVSLLIAIPLARRPNAAGFLLRTIMKGATLHSRLLVGFRLIAVVPVLTLLPLLAVISTITVRDAQLPQVERLATSIATSVPRLVQGRIDGIESLGGHIMAAGHSDETALREALLRHHLSSQEFASLWVARWSGDVVAASAAKDGEVKPWEGPAAGVAMMDSFKRAVMEGGLYISPVKKGAASDEAPMMFISVPISLEGNPNWGFVQGLLNLRAITDGLVSQGTIDSVSAVITDQRNRVILSSPGLALAAFSDLSGHPLMSTAATVQPGKAYSFSGYVNNDGNKAQYVAVTRSLDNGWQVYATATQAKANMTVLVYLAIGLIWALLALMLARGIAPLYGEVVAQPLQKLEESLEVFDAARTITIIPPAPNDAPQEIRRAYACVRESMLSSRVAYRNMLKVVNEGNELRKKLRAVSGSVSQKLRAVSSDDSISSSDTGTFDQTVIAEHEKFASSSDLEIGQESAPITEKIDPVTELAGRPVFEGFFGEAWTLGAADSRPMSVIIVRTGKAEDQNLKDIAQKLKATAGRTLDLVARIGEWDFGMVLPDTDLKGALAIADRMREVLEGREDPICFGVASIVPNPNGNAKSFLDICHRALAAAQQKGDGQIAYVRDKGKFTIYTGEEIHSAEEENADSDKKPGGKKFSLPDADLIDWETGEEASA